MTGVALLALALASGAASAQGAGARPDPAAPAPSRAAPGREDFAALERRLLAAGRLADARRWDEAEREYELILAASPAETRALQGLASVRLLRGEEIAAALLPPATEGGGERARRGPAAATSLRGAADLVEVLAYLGLLPIVLAVPWRMRRTLRRRPALRAFAWYVVPGFVLLNLLLHVAKYAFASPDDEALVESLSEVVLFLGVGAGFLAAVRAERRVPELAGQTVLALGAHPDDIPLGTAGFLLKLEASGARVHALTLTRGEASGAPGPLCAEAEASLRFVGVHGAELLDLPAGRLAASLPAVRAEIEARIRKLGVTLVLTHAAVDVDPDHRAVHEATREAARGVPTVLCYDDVSAPRSFEPNFFVDVSGHLDDHLRAISFLASQAARTYVNPDVVRGRAADRGAQVGLPYALAFRTLNLLR